MFDDTIPGDRAVSNGGLESEMQKLELPFMFPHPQTMPSATPRLYEPSMLFAAQLRLFGMVAGGLVSAS